MSINNLDEEKKTILDQFRRNLEDVLEPAHDDRFLLRWLRARDFNIENAESMLRAALKFLKKMGSDNIVGNYELKKIMQPYEGTAYLGFTECGHLVRFFNLGGCDLKGIVRCMTLSECVEYMVYMMEIDLKRLKEHNEKNGTDVETCVYIADYKGIKVSHLTDKRVVKIIVNLIRLYQDNYPETLHALYLINVPTIFPYIFNLFKSFFHENVLKKISIFACNDSKEAIFKTVPREIVPAYVGGKRYGPGGDPLCHDILNWMGKVPPELYLSNFGALSENEPDVCRTTVRRRSLFEVERHVDKPSMLLSWEFQTKDYDIRFGLFFYRKAEGKRDRKAVQELIPVDNVDSHEMVEKGDFPCKKLGVYVLLFDNTHSWFTSKQLLYRIKLRPATARCSIEDLTC